MATPAFPQGYENENALNIIQPPSAPPEPINNNNSNNNVIYTPDGDPETWQNFQEGFNENSNEIEGKDDEKKSINDINISSKPDPKPIPPSNPNQHQNKIPNPVSIQSDPQSLIQQNFNNNNNANNHIEIKQDRPLMEQKINMEISHYSITDTDIAASYIIKSLPNNKFNATSIVKNLQTNYIDTGLKLHMTSKRIEQFNNIIFQTNIKQRQLIRDEYKKLYADDLMDVIAKKFQYHQIYKQLVSLLFMTEIEVYVYCIEIAIRSMKNVKLLSSLLLIHDNQVQCFCIFRCKIPMYDFPIISEILIFAHDTDCEGDSGGI